MRLRDDWSRAVRICACPVACCVPGVAAADAPSLCPALDDCHDPGTWDPMVSTENRNASPYEGPGEAARGVRWSHDERKVDLRSPIMHADYINYVGVIDGRPGGTMFRYDPAPTLVATATNGLGRINVNGVVTGGRIHKRRNVSPRIIANAPGAVIVTV